jgi:copper chaperone
MESKTFLVPNISCGHCVHTVESELSELPGVEVVRADEATKQVTVQWQDPANWAKIRQVLEEIEYPAVELAK